MEGQFKRGEGCAFPVLWKTKFSAPHAPRSAALLKCSTPCLSSPFIQVLQFLKT